MCKYLSITCIEMIVCLLICWVIIILCFNSTTVILLHIFVIARLHIFVIARLHIFVIARLQQSPHIDKFTLPKILYIPAMPLFFCIIHKFSQLNLQPIHRFISSLYLTQWLLLIGVNKNLYYLPHLLLLFTFARLILFQHSEILLDAITQKDPIIFRQLYMIDGILVQLSMSVTVSRKNGSSSWCIFSANLDSYYWCR
jgi:hypothetical protein